MIDDDLLISERTMAYLEAVATYGTMRAAAEFLEVNVSTISRQIAALQRDLKLSLVSRKGQAVTLTEAGMAMVEYHRERDRQARRFRRQLEEYRGLRQGRLTIGVAEGFVAELISGVLKPFNARFPEISLELRSAGLPDLVRMVRDDEVDICLAVGVERDPSLMLRRFQSEPLCAIVAPTHAFARLASVPIEALQGENVVFMPDHFAVQRHIDAMLNAENIVLTPKFRCDRFATALLLATEGLGVAFMTRRAAGRQVAAGEVVAVPLHHPIARTFDRYIVARAGRRLPPSANFLWKEIVRVMASV